MFSFETEICFPDSEYTELVVPPKKLLTASFSLQPASCVNQVNLGNKNVDVYIRVDVYIGLTLPMVNSPFTIVSSPCIKEVFFTSWDPTRESKKKETSLQDVNCFPLGLKDEQNIKDKLQKII